jgi:Flp pilus assembly pilin Flp
MRRPKWQASARRALAEQESGQTMAEYATLLGVLIIAVAATITVLAGGIDAKLQNDLTNILTGM